MVSRVRSVPDWLFYQLVAFDAAALGVLLVVARRFLDIYRPAAVDADRRAQLNIKNCAPYWRD